VTIKSTSHLKTLIKNQSKGNSIKAQIILRHYGMERFLERVSISSYRDKFIIKGGFLISSIIGTDNRSTLDIDATLRNISFVEKSIREIIETIINIEINDQVKFVVNQVIPIMEEFEYPGIRVTLTVYIDQIRTPLKLDFSTDDIITPNEVKYNYQLMFENRTIPILAYTIETILAEKFETVISRGILNSRMRDFYDIYMIMFLNLKFDKLTFNLAIIKTSTQRGSILLIKDWANTVHDIEKDESLFLSWSLYQKKFEYAQDISYLDTINRIKQLGNLIE
jgi:hypothetical protein